jgi:hypothetical protein
MAVVRVVAVLVVVVVAGCRGNGAITFRDAFVAVDAPAHVGAGPGGGIVDELRFAVVGDTRPSVLDDTAHYPTDVARTIWTAVEAVQPPPAFAITTGDYMFASVTGSEQKPQLDLYLGARAAYTGVVYPAYGNHECNGYTSSNCGDGSADGATSNYHAFLDQLAAPIGESRPYFVERFAATDGSWSAKLVFVAANAWSEPQAQWLDAVLRQPTTYTFVVRHEASVVTSAPGVAPSDAIIAQHPLTQLIAGHEHTYRHDPATKELVVGNGGAPLTTAVDYGYVVVARQPDGTVQATSFQYSTRAQIDQFTFDATGASR